MSTGPVVALLDTVTFPELMTFLVIALIVLGPDKLPGLARSAGQWMQKLRKMAENLQNEVTGALDESEMQSLRELGEFAVRPRAKLAEYARNVGTDPDDHTDGDAPASSAPTLPPLGVGPDNPMITNGAKSGADVDPTGDTSLGSDAVTPDTNIGEFGGGPVVDTSAVEASPPDVSPAATTPPVASAPAPPSGPPAHLAGTRLATGAGTTDPTSRPASDEPVMSDPPVEPSIDDT